MRLREQVENVGDLLLALGLDRVTAIDEHRDVETGCVGSAEAAEVANNELVVNDGEVGFGERIQVAVVLVGGEKREADLGNGAAIGDVGGVGGADEGKAVTEQKTD